MTNTFQYWKEHYPKLDILDPRGNDYHSYLLVGENGTGKSSILSSMVDFYSEQLGLNVIVISNTFQDKFHPRKRGVSYLTWREQTKPISRIFKKSLVDLFKSTFSSRFWIAQVFEYLEFGSLVYFQINVKNENYVEIISEHIKKRETAELIMSLLDRVQFYKYKRNEFSINLKDLFNISNSMGYDILELLTYERKLVQLKIIDKISIQITKHKLEIPLDSSSSGQVSLLNTYLFIASKINEDSIILIDEPENSLHPKWQHDYIEKIYDLFSLFNPRVLIATHSPLVVLGSNNTEGIKTLVINLDKNTSNETKFATEIPKSKSIEETYLHYFNLSAPESHFLSQRLTYLLNQLSKKKISLNDFDISINNFIQSSFDERQKKVINKIKYLGHQLYNKL